MELIILTDEQRHALCDITGVTEDGLIKLKMADGSTWGVAFVPDNGVEIFPPKGVKIERPVFDYDSGAVRGFITRKAE